MSANVETMFSVRETLGMALAVRYGCPCKP